MNDSESVRNFNIVLMFACVFPGKMSSQVFLETSQKYKTEIISFQPFPAPFPVVVLNSYSAIREAMLSPETAEVITGRPIEVPALNINRCGMK